MCRPGVRARAALHAYMSRSRTWPRRAVPPVVVGIHVPKWPPRNLAVRRHPPFAVPRHQRLFVHRPAFAFLQLRLLGLEARDNVDGVCWRGRERGELAADDKVNVQPDGRVLETPKQARGDSANDGAGCKTLA